MRRHRHSQKEPMRSSSGCPVNPGSFTEDFDNDISPDLQPEGHTNFEGNPGQMSEGFHMPWTSNTRFNEVKNTPALPTQQPINPIDTTFFYNPNHDFSADLQPEDFTNFEGNSESTSSNVKCNEIYTNSLSCLQTMNPNDTTQTIDQEKVLRSQRPLETMTFYQLDELSGIVPDHAIIAFQAEQSDFLKANLKREVKNASTKAEKESTRRMVSYDYCKSRKFRAECHECHEISRILLLDFGEPLENIHF